MLAQVNQNPYQLIVLENFESIQPGMIEPFLEILKTSQWKQKSDTHVTSFAACTLIALVTLPTPESNLYDEGFVDDRFLSFCSEIIAWKHLPYRIIAELAALQLCEHWAQHQIEVSYFTPKAILEILKELKPRAHLGMHPIPQVIRQKSAQAIEDAKRIRVGRVSLDVGSNGLFTHQRSAA